MKKILLILFLLPLVLFGQDGVLKTLVAGGVADAYTISESLPSSYDQKERFQVIFPFNNTGAATLKRAGLAIKTIKKNDGTNLNANDIVAGSVYLIAYNSSTGFYQCETCGSSSSGGGAWGSITGTLSNQTDLQSALNAKESILTFGSGLTRTANTIKLGPITDASTSITGGNVYFETNFTNGTNQQVSGISPTAISLYQSSNSGVKRGTITLSSGDVSIQSTGASSNTAELMISQNGGSYFRDTGGSPTGLRAFADYSAGFTSLSYLTKGFADARFAPISVAGSVTSIATTSPITGGTITSTGTIACATCVTSAASLTSNALMIGGGSQTSSTITTGTNVLTALGVNVGSAGAFITNGGAAGTFASGVATNLTGTASGLTAGNVTTNANLTGPITSVGNATSIASQTGTGTTFVMQASPAFTGTPTLGTLGYSDTGILMSLQSSTNSYNQFVIQNTNSGSTASTNFIVSNDLGTASTHYAEFGKNSSGFTGSGSWNIANASYLDDNTDELAIGTIANKTLHFFTNSSTTDRLSIDGSGLFTFNSPINGNTWSSTWTASANSQVSKTFTDGVTMRATASDAATATYFNPSFTLASTTQNPVGLNLDVTFVQTGGISTLAILTATSTAAGMTATTYTGIAPASTSGSGTGALFTVIVGSPTSFTSITQTTSGSGYKVNETVTFNGSQFGSGSGSYIVPIRAVTGVSLGTTSSSVRFGISGVSSSDSPKIIDFYYQGASIGGIQAVVNASGSLTKLGFSDEVSTNFYLNGGAAGATFLKAVTMQSTLNLSSDFTAVAATYSGLLTSSKIGTTGSSNGAILASGASGGIGAASVTQSKFKTSYSLGSTTAGVGIVNTVSLTTGGTSGYTTGSGKATSGGTGTGCTINITTVSGGVITAISSTPTARGSNYSINDVLTVTSGSGNATVTVTAVDFSGGIVSFEDASSITDAVSNNKYYSVYARPTYNISSAQTGTIAALYFDPTLTATGSFNKYGIIIAPTTFSSGFGTSAPTATLHVVGTTKLDGNVTLVSAGNKFFVTEGSNGSVGQTTLVAGTKAITVTGTTTNSRCFATLVSQGGTVTTTSAYACACTSNTVTITAETNSITTNTLDTSIVNYWIVN